MGKLYIISLIAAVVLFIQPLAGQGPAVSLKSSDEWPAGAWSVVEIVISGASGRGPCRLELGFPAGFKCRASDVAGGLLYNAGNDINIAWSKFPPGSELILKVEVMPEVSVQGSAVISGRFYHVNGVNERGVEPVADFTASVGGLARPQSPAVAEGSSRDNPVSVPGLVFRVQVLTSSSRISESELKRRLGVSFSEPVSVIESGGIFKYQVGECAAYDRAESLLGMFRKAGVEGPFIVAYEGGSQIPVAEARRKASGRQN